MTFQYVVRNRACQALSVSFVARSAINHSSSLGANGPSKDRSSHVFTFWLTTMSVRVPPSCIQHVWGGGIAVEKSVETSGVRTMSRGSGVIIS